MAINPSKPRMRTQIITEYEPRFCDLYIEYAKVNLNPSGFWGKYCIDESVKKHWMATYPEFKQTVSLIPNITANLLNESINGILINTQDAKTITQVILKMVDVQFRIDKDSGLLKDTGNERRTVKNSDNSTLDPNDVANMREYLDKI